MDMIRTGPGIWTAIAMSNGLVDNNASRTAVTNDGVEFFLVLPDNAKSHAAVVSRTADYRYSVEVRAMQKPLDTDVMVISATCAAHAAGIALMRATKRTPREEPGSQDLSPLAHAITYDDGDGGLGGIEKR